MNPRVNWRVTLHGLDAGNMQLRRDEVHNALYIELDKDADVQIRVQLVPNAIEDPERHAAGLERDRKALRRLAAVATQAAQEIERWQRDGAQ